MEKTMRLVKFVVGLKKSRNTTLRTLDILEMKDLGDHVISSRLDYHLSTLLAKQTKLCRLSLFNGGLTTAHGLKLLTATGENNAHSIKYLNVCNFSKEKPPVPVVLTFAQRCGSFTNVTELSLNCGYMSDDLLNTLSGTLKLIIVWVNSSDFYFTASDNKYSENGWNALVSKCTGLKAEYHIRDYVKLSLVLLPAIPLATIHWFSREGASEKRIRLNYIINTCKVVKNNTVMLSSSSHLDPLVPCCVEVRYRLQESHTWRSPGILLFPLSVVCMAGLSFVSHLICASMFVLTCFLLAVVLIVEPFSE